MMSVAMLGVVMLVVVLNDICAERRCAECRCTECRGTVERSSISVQKNIIFFFISHPDGDERRTTPLKIHLHVRFCGLMSQYDAICTGIILSKMCSFSLTAKNYFSICRNALNCKIPIFFNCDAE
jgi:hypothetical protein